MILNKLLLLPLFLHVLLIIFVGIRTIRARFKSVRTGQTKLGDIAVNAGAWPRRVQQLGNNFDSQFDLPMLWYSCCGLLVATGLTDVISVALSWFFLLARLVHTSVHIGANDVPTRMRVYLAGFVAVVFMWVWFGIRFYVIG